MRKGTFLTILALLPALAAAGVLDTMWVRSIDGPGRNQFSQASDIYVDSMTGYVYVCGSGEAQYAGSTDMLVAKLSPAGDTLWVKAMGGNEWSQDDMAEALVVDSVGNVYIAGHTNNVAPRGYDMSWAKFDENGNFLWAKKTAWTDDDAAYDIAIGLNEDIYICGTAYDSVTGLSAYAVLSISPATGETVWTRRWLLDTLAVARPPRRDVHPDFFDDYTDWDNCATALAISPDGNVIVTGFGLSSDFDREWWTMKIDFFFGDTMWTRTYHNPTTIFHEDDVPFDVVVSNSGDIYAAGFDYYETGATYEGYNFAVVQYSSLGSRLNWRSFNIAAEDGDDYAFRIALDDSTPQNVYVTGVLCYPLPNLEQMATFKFAPNLTGRWGALGADWGGTLDDRAYDIYCNSGRAYVIGRTGDDLGLLSYTAENPEPGDPKNPAWTWLYSSPDNIEDYGTAVWATDTEHIYFAGQAARAGSPNWSSLIAGRLFYANRDLSVVDILQPPDTVSYPDTVTPMAQIKNNGTDRATFTVWMRIGPSYLDSVPVPLPLGPGEERPVMFRPWIVGTPGVFAVRCSVATTGDPDLSDNVLLDTVVVTTSYRDVGCTRIIAPVGTIDSGTQILPVAMIRNYGLLPETFNALFRIGTAYADTMLVMVPGNDSVMYQFAPWTASPRGQFSVSCTTMLDGDSVSANNRAVDSVRVIIRDVGVIRILDPLGTFDSGAVLTPRAVVKNFGEIRATFQTMFRIENLYANPQPVANLQPGDTAVVSFAPWPAHARGLQHTSCRTALVGDVNPANDEMTDSFTLRVVDAGVVTIVTPIGMVDSGAQVVPRVLAKNYGTAPASFPVWFTLDTMADANPQAAGAARARSQRPGRTPALPGVQTGLLGQNARRLPEAGQDYIYEDSIWVNLAAGESAFADFDTWTVTEMRTYEAKSFTALPGDIHPQNDTAQRIVTVRRPRHDVTAMFLVAPQDTVDSGTVVTPAAVIANMGGVSETFRVRFAIGTVYADTPMVTIMPGDMDTIVFADWTANRVGGHEKCCVTMLVGDEDPMNDSIGGFQVILRPVHDVGVVRFIAPPDTVDSGTVVTPSAIVMNFGQTQETFKVKFTIGTFYADSVMETLGQGLQDTVTFSAWTATQVGTHQKTCFTSLPGDVNRANDTLRRTVTVAGGPPGVEAPPLALPTAFALENGRPNPFSRSVLVRYALPRESHVRVEVISSAGAVVRTLATGARTAGRYSAVWDGRDERGRRTAPGIYYCRFSAPGFLSTGKLIKLN